MSAQSVTEPIPQFHGRDGQPLENGAIYVGTAGLDAQANQIQLYLDPALTVPLAQPVQTLNGYPSNGGTPVAFYAGVGDFSIKILDAQGLLVLDALNVTTRLDASNLTGSISSALVSFTQAGVDAKTRTVESKLRDVVSVFDFMTPAEIAAVKASTFAVDVTARINAAINSGAREVFFPQGGYSITNDGVLGNPAILIPSTSVGVSLVGAGRQAAVIRNVGNGPAIACIGNLILKNTSIRIADMSIEGQPGTQEGVLLDYTAIAVLERLDCYAHGGAGIKIKRSVRVSLNDCWSRSNTGNGVTIENASFFVDVKAGIFEVNANGLVVGSGGGTDCRHVTVTGATFASNTNHNVSLVDGSADVRFFGCDFTVPGGATTRHVSVDGGASTVAGVVLDACTLFGVNGTATTVGLYANACRDVTLSNSVLDCTGADAYALTASALRTRLFDNLVVVGAKVNASASTVVREVVSAPTPGVAFYTGTAALPVSVQAPNNVPLVRFNNQRVWADAGNVFTLASTPLNVADGYIVGPGCDVWTYANRPTAPTIGTRGLCTDCVVNIWGANVVAGGGGFQRFVIWTGANWTVFGVA